MDKSTISLSGKLFEVTGDTTDSRKIQTKMPQQ